MKKYLYIGVVLLTIGIIAFYGLRDKSPGASAAKAATVNPKPRTPKEELQLAESWLVEITKLLNDKLYKEASIIYDQTLERLKEVSENASSSKDSQGIDMAKEVGLLRARINDKLVRAMQAEVDALKAGAPDNRCVFHIQAFFGHAKEVDLWKIYESAVPELDAIRCKQASRWIRIYNSSNNRTDYDDLIFSTLAKRIIVPPGYQIAFGPPVGEMERRALFCTVDTDTRPTHNTYSLSLEGRPHAQLAVNEAKLLISLDLRLTTETRIADRRLLNSNGITSHSTLRMWESWGGRGGEAAVYGLGAVPVGDEFVVKSESVANYSDRHNQRLDASIKAGIGRLARLDELRFYNAEETHSPLSLGQALNDLKSFVSALSQAKPGSDSEVFGWVIVAALGIEELQAELTNRLPTLDNKTRKAIAVALESQPWFGDYAPLSYILKNGTSGVDGDFTATLKALRADVYTDRFWMIIQERIQEQPKLARDIFAQARYARLDHMRQVFECYKKLPAEIAGGFIAEFIISNPKTIDVTLAMISEETEPSRLLSVCATMGAHFRANKHSIPSDAVRKFLLETISKLKDGERAAAIYSTGWVTSIWKKLFEQPRTDWGPSANLAVIHCSISATDVDLEARKSAFNELCMLVTGEHSFTANERKAIDALLPALFDLLSNNGPAPDIRDSKLVTLLLSQPPASPHNKAFAGIIPYLLPGHTPYFSMGHPDALAVIELALKHHDKFVRDSAVAQIRARAPNDPVYKRLLPP